MKWIYKYLNVRHSTRNLDDKEFENLLPSLAEEISKEDYTIIHKEKDLISDWNKLKAYSIGNSNTSSTTRVGMKLCEHFFPNFYKIKNSNGLSFEDAWTAENLEKALRWNRKSHSTPYMSELKRGIYFNCKLVKSTMFRPHLAKIITSSHEGGVVLDPCAGWGGRLLGTVASGKHYIGFETNKETYDNLLKMCEFLKITDKVTLYNVGSEYLNDFVTAPVDIVLTSPPYFNLEIYTSSEKQSENKYLSYEEWRDFWLKGVIVSCLEKLKEDGLSCWNVHNVGKMKLIEDVENIHKEFGFLKQNEFSLTSSKRQVNQNDNKNKKNKDITSCFGRVIK